MSLAVSQPTSTDSYGQKDMLLWGGLVIVHYYLEPEVMGKKVILQKDSEHMYKTGPVCMPYLICQFTNSEIIIMEQE